MWADQFNTSFWARTTVALGILYAALSHFYRRRSALNAVPTIHWSARYSPAWIRWQRLRDRGTLLVHQAHLRHGPVVRLAPRELSVCDVDTSLKPIYDGRLPKTDWYQLAASYGTARMFSMKDEASHRKRRRMVAKPYSKSYLTENREWQERQAGLACDMRATVEKACREAGGEVDFGVLFFAWALASVSTDVFGADAAEHHLDDLAEARTVKVKYDGQLSAALTAVAWSRCVPRWLLGWLGYSTNMTCIEEMRGRADAASAIQAPSKSAEPRSTPYEHMKSQMLRGPPGEPQSDAKQLSRNQQAATASEMQDHIVASVDTSTIALTTCAWLLSLESNRQWQDKLRHESQRFEDPFSAVNIDNSPILEAIIEETLRLYPPVAGRQPRVTDKTISVGPPGHQVTMPAGVTVHAQAWSLHRNPTIFPEPEVWDPQRWLECSPEQPKQMNAWLWAYGSGSRRCLGEHLALSSLEVALVAVYGGFETWVTQKTRFEVKVWNVLQPVTRDGSVLRLHVGKATA